MTHENCSHCQNLPTLRGQNIQDGKRVQIKSLSWRTKGWFKCCQGFGELSVALLPEGGNLKSMVLMFYSLSHIVSLITACLSSEESRKLRYLLALCRSRKSSSCRSRQRAQVRSWSSALLTACPGAWWGTPDPGSQWPGRRTGRGRAGPWMGGGASGGWRGRRQSLRAEWSWPCWGRGRTAAAKLHPGSKTWVKDGRRSLKMQNF